MSEFDFQRRLYDARQRRMDRLKAQVQQWQTIAIIGWGVAFIIVGCLVLVKVGWM